MKYSIGCNILYNYETGLLEIRVLDSRNIPISNALISVSKVAYTGIYNESAEGIVIAELNTDNSGKIQMELSALNELTDHNAFYSAKISKEGHYDVLIYYIQIYPNIISSYDVYLNPRTNGVERVMYLFQPKRRSVHTH